MTYLGVGWSLIFGVAAAVNRVSGAPTIQCSETFLGLAFAAGLLDGAGAEGFGICVGSWGVSLGIGTCFACNTIKGFQSCFFYWIWTTSTTNQKLKDVLK